MVPALKKLTGKKEMSFNQLKYVAHIQIKRLQMCKMGAIKFAGIGLGQVLWKRG